jgi:hypothetical protein
MDVRLDPPERPADPAPVAYDPDDDPIDIPTTGLPPSLAGALVLGAMVVVAVTFFLLLR